jgi:hypothetical protein
MNWADAAPATPQMMWFRLLAQVCRWPWQHGWYELSLVLEHDSCLPGTEE